MDVRIFFGFEYIFTRDPLLPENPILNYDKRLQKLQPHHRLMKARCLTVGKSSWNATNLVYMARSGTQTTLSVRINFRISRLGKTDQKIR